MKILKIVFVIVCVFIHTTLSGNNVVVFENDTMPEEIFKIVEYAPHYAGCEHIKDKKERKACSDKKIIQFIQENVKYPAIAREEGTEGTVYIQFVIDKDGSITNPKVVKTPPNGLVLGEESLRVVKLMPKWVPGKQEGETVKVKFTLPIKFQLRSNFIEPEAPVTVYVDWDKVKIKKEAKKVNYANGEIYPNGEISQKEIKEVLSSTNKKLTLRLYGAIKKEYYTYFISIGKQGKKYLITSTGEKMSIRKKILKKIKSGEQLYFYAPQTQKIIFVFKII